MAIGGLVSAIKRQDDDLFKKLLYKTRAEVMGVLSAASMESYQRAYPYITKLHMLHGTNWTKNAFLGCLGTYFFLELEQTFNLGTMDEGEGSLLTSWDIRLRLTQPSFKTREPILNLRR